MQNYLNIVFCLLISIGCQRRGEDRAKNNDVNPAADSRTAHNISRDLSASHDELSNLSADELTAIVRDSLLNITNGNSLALLNDALRQLAIKDPIAALELSSDPAMLQKGLGFSDVVSIVSIADPELFCSWFEGKLATVSLTDKTLLLNTGIRAYSEINPKSSIALLSNLNLNSDERHLPLTSVFWNYEKMFPGMAEKAAKDLLDGRELQTALHSIAVSMAQTDPAAGIVAAKNISDLSLRGDAVGQILGRLAESDPEEVIKNLKSLENAEIQNILNRSPSNPDSLLNKLLAIDLQTVKSLLGDIVITDNNYQMFSALAGRLATDSGQDIVGWLDSFPAGGLKSRLIEDCFATKTTFAKEKAVSDAVALTDPVARNSALQGVAGAVAASGIDNVVLTMQNLNAEDQTLFFESAFDKSCSIDPKRASEMLTELSKSINFADNKLDSMYETLSANLYQVDTKYMDDWFADLPENVQPAAMRGLAEKMAENNLIGLSDKLSNMTPSPMWAAGVRVLIKHAKNSDAAAVQQWTSALEKAGYLK